MNLVPQENLPQNTVITLKEITDLLEVRHDRAIKVIEKLAQEPTFGTMYDIDIVYNEQGQKVKTYALNKIQAIAVGAKLNNELLMRLVNKLETKQIALPSKIELAQMVIEAETKVLALENTVKIKDEIILAVADLNIKAGEVSIADFAKNLAIKGLGQNNLYVYLRGRGYLMLNNAPYSQYVERGYFVRKPTKEKHGGEIRYKTMITPKGTVWLTKIIKAEYEIDDA